MPNVKHGETGGGCKSPEYQAWESMRARCHNVNHAAYGRYGGRGIKVCRRWSSFDNFLADMGRRPRRGYSLDRIDNEGDYAPDNCRWATENEQHRNKRSNRLLTHEGETLTLVEWSERVGLSRKVIQDRLTSGWSVSRALTTSAERHVKRFITHNGETLSAPEWSKRTGISAYVLRTRVFQQGWSAARALTTPIQKKGATA